MIDDGIVHQHAHCAEPGEAARLSAVYRTGALESACDHALDDLVRITARDLASPAAAVALFDADRVWFTSAVGLDVGRIDRDDAPCDHPRHGTRSCVIEDIAQEPRLSEATLAAAGRPIRSYAGVPLVVDGGQVIGCLCVMDGEPRKFAPGEMETLAVLARAVATHLELRMRAADHERDRATWAETVGELGATADRLSHVQRLARIGSWEYLVDDDVLTWTDEVYAIVGLDPTDRLPTPALWRSLIHPDDQAAMAAAERRLWFGEKTRMDMELRIVRPDGQIRHVWSHAEIVGDDPRRCLLGTLQDITERKQIEARLSTVEADLAMASRLAHVGAWTVDLERGKVTWSDEIYTIHELPVGTPISIDGGMEYFAPETRERARAVFEACAHDGIPFDEEQQLVTARGRRIWVRGIGLPVRNRDGRIVAVRGAFQDIDALKRSEQDAHAAAEALRQSEQRFKLFARATADTIWECDSRSGVVWWSEDFPTRLGYSAAEMPPHHESWRSRIHPDDLDSVLTIQQEAYAGDGDQWEAAYRLVRRDGSVMHVLDRAFLMRDADGQLVREVGGLTDISQRVEYEERLHQAQRLESIGHLTGGIAHDFNNLLTVILGNAELLREGIADERLGRLAHITTSAAQRGADLTSRLLSFARRQTLHPRAIEVNRLIADMDELLRRTIGGAIEIKIVRDDDLWHALADPAQLEGAILNLCINARDAMPLGGRLSIETANVNLDEDYASAHEGVSPGPYVLMAVTDTGSGMSPEVMAQAFEPFFTTKGVGKGSGLGLSVIYGFVKQSGGHVRIESEVGQGTTVQLYLPRAHSMAEPETAGQHGSGESGGTERVLVVEDDALVRKHVTALLEGLGYSVTAAANGPEAMRIIDRDEALDLLFTDVVMPGGMNGRQLADAARERRPGLRVLFTSGYTEDTILRHGRGDRGVQLISKPYRRRDLARKLRLVLDEPLPQPGIG